MAAPHTGDRPKEADQIITSLKAVDEASKPLRPAAIHGVGRVRSEVGQSTTRSDSDRGSPAVGEHADQKPGDLSIRGIPVRVHQLYRIATQQRGAIGVSEERIEGLPQRAVGASRQQLCPQLVTGCDGGIHSFQRAEIDPAATVSRRQWEFAF